MNFISRTSPSGSGRAPAYWFVFQGDNLLVHPAGQHAELPQLDDVSALGVAPLRQLYLGCLSENDQGQEIDCYCAEIAADTPLPEGIAADGLRALYPRLDEVMFGLAGRAVQVLAWDRTHQYCGQCGAPTEPLPDERARRCPQCDLLNYPRLSPAIIIAVVRHSDEGDRLLLARNHRFPAGRYSVIAGFVEPGESLEECAQREVFEEVGIRIKNIRYFGSQPWPFPHSLMIGFTAEYESGELALEESEIAEAGWFAADALPGVPPKMSIARRLIDWFSENGREPASAGGTPGEQRPA
jgi:NAD+ diphosphatase